MPAAGRALAVSLPGQSNATPQSDQRISGRPPGLRHTRRLEVGRVIRPVYPAPRGVRRRLNDGARAPPERGNEPGQVRRLRRLDCAVACVSRGGVGVQYRIAQASGERRGSPAGASSKAGGRGPVTPAAADPRPPKRPSPFPISTKIGGAQVHVKRVGS